MHRICPCQHGANRRMKDAPPQEHPSIILTYFSAHTSFTCFCCHNAPSEGYWQLIPLNNLGIPHQKSSSKKDGLFCILRGFDPFKPQGDGEDFLTEKQGVIELPPGTSFPNYSSALHAMRPVIAVPQYSSGEHGA